MIKFTDQVFDEKEVVHIYREDILTGLGIDEVYCRTIYVLRGDYKVNCFHRRTEKAPLYDDERE